MNLRPVEHGDTFEVAARLRACDRQEIALGSGRVPLYVLQDAVKAGFSQAICTDQDVPVAIWGIAPLTPGVGSIWMLGTPELESIPLSFLRACRPALARAHALYPTLACAAWRENALHLNWLRWLGFTANDVGHPHFIPHYRHV
ncbi:hypothetical protein [Variovorax paradoxus]|uniref:hypothetical protein n=1 Tax=Variovorax paradoxus TaxID=34073 RepID=UPI0028654DA3|nr:hypothetical protein [Variovorax paradoxus]MDR6455499.1 hypothetical protein [Variovorax paradoxus]